MKTIIFKSIELQNNKYECVKADNDLPCSNCDLRSYCDDIDNYGGIFDLCGKNLRGYHFKIKK